MFDIDASEFLVVGIVALLVIGPKDLPRVMRTVGHWVGRARGMARHLRAGFDTMVRESEIEEMNKRWEAENQAIMASTRNVLEVPSWPLATSDPTLPAPSHEPTWPEAQSTPDALPQAATPVQAHPDPAQ